MFNWMNRTVYYTIKYFILYFGGFITAVVGLTAIVTLFKYVEQVYGSEAVNAMLWCSIIVIACGVFAYNRAKTAVIFEKQEQDRIEDALRRNWD